VTRETHKPLPVPGELPVLQSARMPIHELWQPAYRGRTAMLVVFHLLQTIHDLEGYWLP
jgi:hypothetical protein